MNLRDRYNKHIRTVTDQFSRLNKFVKYRAREWMDAGSSAPVYSV